MIDLELYSLKKWFTSTPITTSFLPYFLQQNNLSSNELICITKPHYPIKTIKTSQKNEVMRWKKLCNNLLLRLFC
jgi:hypothetical protein